MKLQFHSCSQISICFLTAKFRNLRLFSVVDKINMITLLLILFKKYIYKNIFCVAIML